MHQVKETKEDQWKLTKSISKKRNEGKDKIFVLLVEKQATELQTTKKEDHGQETPRRR